MDGSVGAGQGLRQPADVGEVVRQELRTEVREISRATRVTDEGNDAVPSISEDPDEGPSDEPPAARNDDALRSQLGLAGDGATAAPAAARSANAIVGRAAPTLTGQ
jgi:hypothetical protein